MRCRDGRSSRPPGAALAAERGRATPSSSQARSELGSRRRRERPPGSLDAISSSDVRAVARAPASSVLTAAPSVAGVVQAATGPTTPSTATMQVRQEP